MDTPHSIGARIRQVRGELSQKTFGQRIGRSQTAVTALENNLSLPSLATLTRIVDAFHVNPDWLRTGTASAAAPAPPLSPAPAPVAESPLVLSLRAELRAAQAEHRQDMARVQKEFRQDLHAAGRTWQYTVDTMRRALDQQEAQLAELQAENHELKVRLGLRLPSPAEAGLFAAPAPASVAPIGFGVRPPQGAEMRARPGGRYFSRLRKVA